MVGCGLERLVPRRQLNSEVDLFHEMTGKLWRMKDTAWCIIVGLGDIRVFVVENQGSLACGSFRRPWNFEDGRVYSLPSNESLVGAGKVFELACRCRETRLGRAD